MLTHLQQHKILPGATRPGEEQTSPSRFAPLERSGWQPVVPCLAPTGLDPDLARTLVASQKDPDCFASEPVAFCRGRTLLGAELRPVLWYAENEVGELRCSQPGITQVEEPTPFRPGGITPSRLP